MLPSIHPITYATDGSAVSIPDGSDNSERPREAANATQATGLWRPSKYLRSSNVTRADQVYGILVHPFHPLTLGIGDTIPLKNHLFIAGESTTVVFELVKKIVGEWPIFVFDKFLTRNAILLEFEGKFNVEYSTQDLFSLKFESLIIQSMLSRTPTSPFVEHSWSPQDPEIDAEPIV
ncbi:hypothetical protein GP486_002471 [Trichoglossum hirsutum]|uniref:Uncharacterized protein n=1 Tax=Trichoglossum hirsutum TaxID=265104 RepID=A0A9P8LEW5_9PEZI|nr:hypothetical protein GP486_002471 [Trichoglossum hirsutum]